MRGLNNLGNLTTCLYKLKRVSRSFVKPQRGYYERTDLDILLHTDVLLRDVNVINNVQGLIVR